MADVIPIAPARERFAHRIQARAHRDRPWREAKGKRQESEAEERERASAEARAYWLAELATWPEPFQRAARATVEYRTEPENVLEHWGVQALEERRHGEATENGWIDYGTVLRKRLGELREAIVTLREARRRGHLNWITKRRQELEGVKRGLLEMLWLFGRRKILRSELEEEARVWCAEQPQGLRESAEDLRAQVRSIRKRIKGGVYDYGPKKGQPLGPEFKARLRRKMRELERQRAEALVRADEIEAEPDPLIAWGLYTRTHRLRAAELTG